MFLYVFFILIFYFVLVKTHLHIKLHTTTNIQTCTTENYKYISIYFFLLFFLIRVQGKG